MKNIIFGLFVLFFALSVYGCTLNLEKESKNINSYKADLVLDYDAKKIIGNMDIDFTNNSNLTINSLKFNIFANAFRENSNQDVISLGKYVECYYNGNSYGGIKINSVTEGNANLHYNICGVDENVLEIILNNDLLSTKSVVVNIDFEITIPNISHRFGYGENTINLGNILPVLCVFENGDWTEIEYSSNGDPFYSEVANYEVSIEYPNNLTLVSSGLQTETLTINNVNTTKIEAKAIRDFAMVFSDKFSKLTNNVDSIIINYYYYDDNSPEKSLETSTLAIETFNNLFGKYPYKEFNVVQSNFCIGGMEFPNIVLIGDKISNYEDYEYVIVHEIAHQWWYGVVGNNQTKNSWLDEGLAEYSTALFYQKNSGYSTTYEKLVKRANTSLSIYQEVYTTVLGDADTTMNRSLREFKTENEYVYTAYIKGFLLFDSLSNLLSEKVVIKCLKNYFYTYAFQISTPELLIASFEKTTSCNLEGFFNSWINGKVVAFN